VIFYITYKAYKIFLFQKLCDDMYILGIHCFSRYIMWRKTL